MPLTEKVSFTAVLQRVNRVQVHRVVRWRFKMDSEQVLKVTVYPVELRTEARSFYARMDKSGRITVPKLTRELVEACMEKAV